MRNNAAMTAPLTPESLAALRKSYERAELDETHSADDPLKQFERWLAEAVEAKLPEPNAMTLSTVGGDLRPSSRIVLIKGYDARGIVWYTNYESRKGRELAGNPYAALQFHSVEAHALAAASAALGRLPARARPLGVLAGPQEPAARPAALPAPGRRLGARAARALSARVKPRRARP